MDTTAGIIGHVIDGHYAVTVRIEERGGRLLPHPGLDLWDTRDNTHLGSVELRGIWRTKIVDERLLIIEADERIQVHTLPNLDLVWDLDIPGSKGPQAMLTFDREHVVIVEDKGDAEVRNLHTGEATGSSFRLPLPEMSYSIGPTEPRPVHLQPLPDGELLAIGADSRSLERWDWNNGNQVETISLPNVEGLIAFLPVPDSEKFIFFRRSDEVERKLEVWEIRDDKAAKTDTLITATWNDTMPIRTKGSEAIALQNGTTMNVWNLDGERILSLPVPEGMTPVAADIDAHTLLAHGPMGGALTYSLEPDQWIRHLCGLVGGRDLTEAEMRNLPTGTRTDEICRTT
ncbi:hypothetical protein [Allosalinactinospora lopnorensis]|uniref:hypothetical protein n=1 Tax=Allosalinactinospora lopnorensis TaxID=1352348 RepID=UPI000623E9D8|nr:hypothetical protein [Allosalinactinospora lopnorensis]